VSPHKVESDRFKGYRILVVDDHEMNVYIAEQLLHQWGAATLRASNGQQAVEMVRQQPIDLVLMDYQMPLLSGTEATQAIRKSGHERSQIPIIAITAAVLPEERERCLASGMND
ncbi:response regulator, partial [Arthrospira platensis SPKY1]|nr:response regulator [Arthrospira platensis SPKY1]